MRASAKQLPREYESRVRAPTAHLGAYSGFRKMLQLYYTLLYYYTPLYCYTLQLYYIVVVVVVAATTTKAVRSVGAAGGGKKKDPSGPTA